MIRRLFTASLHSLSCTKRTPPCVVATCTVAQRSAASTPPFVDHYDRLHVHAEATPAEIKQAYRKRALECHPDVVASDKKAAAEVEFRKVSESYEFLSDNAQRKAYDKLHQKHVPPHKRKFKKPSPAPTATAAPTAAPKPAKPPTGAAKKTSSDNRSTSKKASSFVRRDADRVFKDAFDGMSLDDVMFQVRRRERLHRAKETLRRSETASSTASEDGKGSSSTPSSQGSEFSRSEKPAGHDEVMSRLLGEAARRFSERVAKNYGHEALKGARFVRVRPPELGAEPPSSKLPFRPFPGLAVPEGVEIPADPVMGPVTHISAQPVEDIIQPLRSRRFVLAPGEKDPKTREETLRKLRDSAMQGPHNMGQVYSYHRSY